MKELELERKLEAVIGQWRHRTFTLDTFRDRGELLLNVDATMKIMSQMKDSQGPRNDALDRGAYWRHLTNTMDRPEIARSHWTRSETAVNFY